MVARKQREVPETERPGRAGKRVGGALNGGRPPATWDVFLSYCSTDAEKVRMLVRELRGAGLRVFRDADQLPYFGSVSQRLLREISASRVLVAYYSRDYAESRPCQEELMHAFLAGQRAGDPLKRIVFINPELDTEHVHQHELRRDANCLTAPRSKRALREVAGAVLDAARSHPDGIGPEGTECPRPAAQPATRGSGLFICRYREEWELHAILNRHEIRVTDGRSPALAVVHGPPGVGKSMLVADYAYRFQSAYPGGTGWLSADDAPGRPGGRGNRPAGRSGGRVLRVIDDVPENLPEKQLNELLAPLPDGPTVLISRFPQQLPCGAGLAVRQMSYGDFVHAFQEPLLRDDSGAELLTSIYASGGGHPALLRILEGRVAKYGLRAVAEDFLSPASTLARPVADTLLAYVEGVGDSTLDLMRALCYLPVPAPVCLVRDILADDPDERSGGRTRDSPRAVEARLSRCADLGLIRMSGGEVWVSPIASYVFRNFDADWVRHDRVRRAATCVSAPSPAGNRAGARLRKRRDAEERERRAAFGLQVAFAASDLTVRVHKRSDLRKSLNSVRKLLRAARSALETAGSATTLRSGTRVDHVQHSVMNLFNLLQPIVVEWESRLCSYLELRPPGVERLAHEERWQHREEVWRQLETAVAELDEIRSELAHVTGAGEGWVR
ncbi:TIR domain-containing protein [Streptomyces sp. NPDC054796]